MKKYFKKFNDIPEISYDASERFYSRIIKNINDEVYCKSLISSELHNVSYLNFTKKLDSNKDRVTYFIKGKKYKILRTMKLICVNIENNILWETNHVYLFDENGELKTVPELEILNGIMEEKMSFGKHLLFEKVREFKRSYI
jgi:hypothetical protein